MKNKRFFCIGIFTFLVIGLYAQIVSLDEAVKTGAKDIEARLPRGTKVAVLNFNSPSLRFSNYVLDEMMFELVKSGLLTVVDRANIEHVRGELGFQMTGEVSDSSAQSIGQMLGAQSIISGRIDDLGSHYRISFQTIAVESAAIQVLSRINVHKHDQIAALMGSQGEPASPVTGNTRPLVIESKYKIGDIGPGGGIVFSIEGHTHMEVSNTLGEYNQKNAMQIARDYKGGGFSDWRLPSKDELNLIYQNLQKSGLVNIGSGRFWSSSDAGGINGWVQRFRDGAQDFVPKLAVNGVRAIRAFN